MTRQSNFEDEDEDEDEDEEIFPSIASPPPSKRRKSSRVPSGSAQTSKPQPAADPEPTDRETHSKRKSRRITTNTRKLNKSAVAIDSTTETTEEIDASPISNRRITRSRLTLPPVEDDPVDKDDVPEEKIMVRLMNKHGRTKSRNVSALSKIVSEVDKTPSRRVTRTKTVENLEPTPVSKPVDDEETSPKKKRGRQFKVQQVDEDEEAPVTTSPKTNRRTRQSNISHSVEGDDDETVESETPAEPLKALLVPKRKRASTRKTRTVSTVAVEELPDIEESEPEVIPARRTRASGRAAAVPVIEIPDPKDEEDSEPAEPEIEEVPVPAPRETKPGRGRGRSTTVRSSTVSNPPEVVPAKPIRRGGRAASKRNISAVHPEPDVTSPLPKRKASGRRSIQKIPTPADDSASDVFEDSKSTFSDVDDTPVRGKSSRRGRGTRQIRASRSRPLRSEERETEDGAPSTIYHSADDYISSPTQSSVMGKSKREMVDNAKKELQEEIWREKVANGEIGMGGSSEDEEKENAAEEKGKKPTRTVRGKGSKGRGKAKMNSKKGKLVTATEVSEEEDGNESVGQSHALVVKAMISPLRPGPLVPVPPEDEDPSDVSSVDDRLGRVNGQVTPIQSPKRKVLNWTPAKIDDVVAAPTPNGSLPPEEEDMTVDQWMRWVINDEVNRLEGECEKLVRNLVKEGDRARRLLENLV